MTFHPSIPIVLFSCFLMYDFLKIIKRETTSLPGFSRGGVCECTPEVAQSTFWQQRQHVVFISERAEDRLRRVSDSFAYLNPTTITREIDLFHNGGLSTYSFIV